MTPAADAIPSFGAPREGRYHLRAVRAEDAPAVLEAHRSAPDMSRQGTVTTLAEAREQVSWLRAADRRAVAIAAAGEDPPGPSALVGIVALSIDAENRVGWFFYWLHAAHRGQGLAARAAATVANHALLPSAASGWGLERLELGHRADNPASGAVARAAGFVPEGCEREKFLIDGERCDVLTYGRLVHDPVPSTPTLAWQD